jgi:hypothetical protein
MRIAVSGNKKHVCMKANAVSLLSVRTLAAGREWRGGRSAAL